jgi:hypothetical protein
MRWRTVLLVPLIGLVAVSCERQPAAPDGDAVVAEAPTFNFMNNPKQGPVIYRDEYVTMIGEFYEETPAGEPWWIWAGMPEDPADHHICNGGAYTLVPAWEYQDVVRDHRDNSLEMRKGARLAVWTDEFWDVLINDGWCAAISLPQIASGEASMEMRNDNDYYGQTGHNVFGYKMQGTIVWEGTKYHVQSVEKLQCNESLGDCRTLVDWARIF